MTDSSEKHDLLEIGLQGMTDHSQIAVAVAIGIFGILAVLAALKTVGHDNEFWFFVANVILTIAYIGLVLLGVVSMAHHRVYSLVVSAYMKEKHGGFEDKLKSYAKDNWFSRISLRYLCDSKKTNKISTYTLSGSFIIISILMLVFVLLV